LQYLLKLTHDDDAAVYSSLGNIAKERGNLKQAEEDYLKSISLSDDNYFYFLNLAEVYLDLEEQEKALEVAQRALLLSPNNPKVLDFLIDISIIMADYELGKQYLDKLREVNPENQKISELQERIDNL
jgi:tetratricopeptide (TPR) repeat protein